MIAPREIDPEQAHGNLRARPQRDQEAVLPGTPTTLRSLLTRSPLLIFGGCILLFHLSNAAMLPLMGSVLTTRLSDWATVLIAACMVGPQLVVAVFSPWVGRRAQQWGRRPLLIAAFAVVPIRAILFATVHDPYLLVAVQLFDGLTASVFSVLVPLTIADLTRGTGRFNLAQGMVGTMTGIGASLSPTLAGYVTDTYDSSAAFLSLAAVAALGFTAVTLLMPETRPRSQPPPPP